MIIKIAEIIFVLFVAFLIGKEKKEKKEKKLADAFILFIGVIIALSICYLAWYFKWVASIPQWTPFDFLVIAAFCYIVSAGAEFLKKKKA